MEYLRLRRPNNTEMMTLLTLRFSMEREHAEIIEGEARKKLKEIRIKKPGAVYVLVNLQWSRQSM